MLLKYKQKSRRAKRQDLEYFNICYAVLFLFVDVFRGGGEDAFDVFRVDIADVADAEGVGFGDFSGVEDVALGFHEFVEVFEVEGFVGVEERGDDRRLEFFAEQGP